MISFISGLFLSQAKTNFSRLKFISSIVALFVPIAFYKYTLPFFGNSIANESADFYFGIVDFNLGQYAVPLGISYFTYQALAYVIDVYRSRIQATKNILVFFAFMSYFPQLFIGPISRYSDLEKELTQKKDFDFSLAMEGVFLVLVGLMKKMIISENLSPLLKNLFYFNTTWSFSWVAVFLAPCLLFFDFSSYSDICRGVSKIFNIQLISNFDSPLTKKTVNSFWASWHVSLYLWLRDYVFLPLLSISTKKAIIYVWIFITFIFSGFWHGPEAKFIMVGIIAAVFVTLENVTKNFLGKITNNISNLALSYLLNIYTYVAMSFILLFYLAPNASVYFKLIYSLFKIRQSNLGLIGFNEIQFESKIAIYVAIIFVLLEHNKNYLKQRLLSLPRLAQWSLVVISLIFILVFYKTSLKPFIYFFS